MIKVLRSRFQYIQRFSRKPDKESGYLKIFCRIYTFSIISGSAEIEVLVKTTYQHRYV